MLPDGLWRLVESGDLLRLGRVRAHGSRAADRTWQSTRRLRPVGVALW
jgi:hypothetical protein